MTELREGDPVLLLHDGEWVPGVLLALSFSHPRDPSLYWVCRTGKDSGGSGRRPEWLTRDRIKPRPQPVAAEPQQPAAESEPALLPLGTRVEFDSSGITMTGWITGYFAGGYEIQRGMTDGDYLRNHDEVRPLPPEPEPAAVQDEDGPYRVKATYGGFEVVTVDGRTAFQTNSGHAVIFPHEDVANHCKAALNLGAKASKGK